MTLFLVSLYDLNGHYISDVICILNTLEAAVAKCATMNLSMPAEWKGAKLYDFEERKLGG